MSQDVAYTYGLFFFFSSRRRHTRFDCDWSSDVCSSDLVSGLPWARAENDFRRRADRARRAKIARTGSGPPLAPRREADGRLLQKRVAGRGAALWPERRGVLSVPAGEFQTHVAPRFRHGGDRVSVLARRQDEQNHA